jgi:hypothetical protein
MHHLAMELCSEKCVIRHIVWTSETQLCEHWHKHKWWPLDANKSHSERMMHEATSSISQCTVVTLVNLFINRSTLWNNNEMHKAVTVIYCHYQAFVLHNVECAESTVQHSRFIGTSITTNTWVMCYDITNKSSGNRNFSSPL